MALTQIGRYEIKSEIGRGGMSTVYHAYDPRFKRDVAIKVMPRELLHDPTFKERFEREAETVAALDHPAVVPVYDFGEEDGQPYMVLRLMTNGSLEDRIKNGPISVAEASRILSQLAPALDEAHSRGIIHRDLKPGNILFDQRDLPYLSDFGIVKIMQSPTTLTGSNILGTPAYMSPEQGRGERDVDGRSDIYSLGAILFEMLTGKVPYDSETPTGQIIQHINDPIPDIMIVRKDLPEGCQSIIARSMAKRKFARYSTVHEMAQAMEDVRNGKKLPAIKATYIGPIDTGKIQSREKQLPPKVKVRRKLPTWLTIVIILVFFGTLTGLTWSVFADSPGSKTPTEASLGGGYTTQAVPESTSTEEVSAIIMPVELLSTNPPITMTPTLVAFTTTAIPTETSLPTSTPTWTATPTDIPTNTPFPTQPPPTSTTKPKQKPSKTPTPPPPPGGGYP
jgi:serine/threonine-protein kinase